MIDDIIKLEENKKVIGIEELMNFKGVMEKENEWMEKIRDFKGRNIEGKEKIMRGIDINGYIEEGIRKENEEKKEEEEMEKMRKGM